MNDSKKDDESGAGRQTPFYTCITGFLIYTYFPLVKI